MPGCVWVSFCVFNSLDIGQKALGFHHSGALPCPAASLNCAPPPVPEAIHAQDILSNGASPCLACYVSVVLHVKKPAAQLMEIKGSQSEQLFVPCAQTCA